MKDYIMWFNVWIKILVFINSFYREVVEIKFYLCILFNKKNFSDCLICEDDIKGS